MFMLRGGRPEKYRENWKGEIKHTGTVAASVDLSKLSDEHFEQLGAIFEIATRSDEQPRYVNGLSRGEGAAREESNCPLLSRFWAVPPRTVYKALAVLCRWRAACT